MSTNNIADSPVADVHLENNGEIIAEKFDEACKRALETIGLEAVRNAVINITDQYKAVDTGLLRNSIAYALSGQKANIDKYEADKASTVTDEQGNTTQEVRSGKYAGTAPNEDGEQPKTVYIGSNVSYATYVELGTSKMAARPFLKMAITENTEQYKKILEDEMKKG